MSGALAPTVHQLKIGLQGAPPPLWRRIQVPPASLGFLHLDEAVAIAARHPQANGGKLELRPFWTDED